MGNTIRNVPCFTNEGLDFSGFLRRPIADIAQQHVGHLNGKPAYVAYISGGQLNVLAPDDGTIGPVQVQVTTAAGVSNSFTAVKSQLSPAFFQGGDGQVAAIHADGSPVTASNPASVGETIVLFGTGFGPTNPPLGSGQLVTQSAPLANTVTITVGNEPAKVVFTGLQSQGSISSTSWCQAGWRPAPLPWPLWLGAASHRQASCCLSENN